LKTGENSWSYKVDIPNFDRIKNRMYRPIHSKVFKIANSLLQLQIHPSEVNCENDAYAETFYVAVMLKNLSDWQVKVKAKLRVTSILHSVDENIEDYTRDIYPFWFDPDDEWGVNYFIPHSKCIKGKALNENGTLMIQADIEILEEQVLRDTDLSKNEQDKLRCEIIKTTAEVKDLKRDVKKDMKHIGNELKDLKNKEIDLIKKEVVEIKEELKGIKEEQKVTKNEFMSLKEFMSAQMMEIRTIVSNLVSVPSSSSSSPLQPMKNYITKPDRDEADIMLPPPVSKRLKTDQEYMEHMDLKQEPKRV